MPWRGGQMYGDPEELVRLLSGQRWDEYLQENKLPSTWTLRELCVQGVLLMEDCMESVHLVRQLADLLLQRVPTRCPIQTIESITLEYSNPRRDDDDDDDDEGRDHYFGEYSFSMIEQLCRFIQNLPLNNISFKFRQVNSFHPQLRTLILSSLSKNRHLKYLSMDGYEFTQILPNQLIPQNPLLRLSLFFSNLGNEEASILMRAAFDGKTSTIQYLCLEDAKVTVLDPVAIAFLKSNTQLQHLILNNNRFGDAGASLLAEALTVNKSLKKLEIDWCDIGDDGCIALAAALQVNNTLQQLKLKTNKMNEDGSMRELGEASVRAFVEAFRMNRTVQDFTTDDGEMARQLSKLVRELLSPLRVTKVIDHGVEAYADDFWVMEFIFTFGKKCRELRDGTIHDESATFRWFLPLFRSTHPLVKKNVLFLMLRQRAEVTSQFLLLQSQKSTALLQAQEKQEVLNK